jgi:ABC-type sugar transport system ATPase subunit
MGAGRTELARAVYGVDPIESGCIRYKGEELRAMGPRKWVTRGMAFITENRRDEGLLLTKNISDNISLVNLRKLKKRLGRLDRKKQSSDCRRVIERLRIKTAAENKQLAKNLSGGNQQKTVIGKWLLIQPDLFILDEPTRGVDVGAKFEIYTHINQLALEGSGILFISSEMEELMGVCDRILVMNKGRITGELDRSEFSQDNLLKLAIGDGVHAG